MVYFNDAVFSGGEVDFGVKLPEKEDRSQTQGPAHCP
jgi:hypothetical protein